MEKVFGEKITKLKFFGFDYFDFGGAKHLIAQSGWSKQGGYEIYVENTEAGLKLYDHLFEIGKEFNVKPGCPNLIERIESGLLSHGNDMDNGDNPYECGFDKYINIDSDINYSFTFDEETACIGAPLLIKELKKRGFKKGICIVGEPTNMKIIDAHKGAYEYTTYFEGLAGHSSQPHKGVSAVEYAARYVNKLIELREKLKDRVPKNSIFDPPYSTLSVGGIFGGIAHNVISDKCHVKWETRPVVKDDAVYLNTELDKYVNEILLPEMKKVYPNSKISKEIIGEIIGFDRDEKSEACEFVSSITGDNS